MINSEIMWNILLVNLCQFQSQCILFNLTKSHIVCHYPLILHVAMTWSILGVVGTSSPETMVKQKHDIYWKIAFSSFFHGLSHGFSMAFPMDFPMVFPMDSRPGPSQVLPRRRQLRRGLGPGLNATHRVDHGADLLHHHQGPDGDGGTIGILNIV